MRRGNFRVESVDIFRNEIRKLRNEVSEGAQLNPNGYEGRINDISISGEIGAQLNDFKAARGRCTSRSEL